MSTMRTSDQIDQLVIGLHGFHGAITPPKKNKTGDAGTYTYEYADLASLLDHCKPALQANGLIFTSAGLTSRIVHKSGQWIETDFPCDIEGLPPQKIGAAFSYGRRYCLQGLLGLAADEDTDAADVPAPPPQKAAGTTRAPKKDPEPAPTPTNAAAGKPAPTAAGPKKLDVAGALPEGWNGDASTANALKDAESVRFIGYAQPKTLSNNAVKMGVRVRFADGTEGWADSWDAIDHKPIQDAILAAKRAKQDGVDVYAVFEREPKKDGNGEWIKISEWMPR